MSEMVLYRPVKLSEDINLSLSLHSTKGSPYLIVINTQHVSFSIHLSISEMKAFSEGVKAFSEEVLK